MCGARPFGCQHLVGKIALGYIDIKDTAALSELAPGLLAGRVVRFDDVILAAAMQLRIPDHEFYNVARRNKGMPELAPARWSIRWLKGLAERGWRPKKFAVRRPAIVLRATDTDRERFLKRCVTGIRGKVLIKPNINSDDSFPGTTRPELLAELIALLKDRGCEIAVGDMSGVSWPNTRRNARKVGIMAAVEKAGVPLLYFEDYSWLEMDFGTAIGKFYITEKLADFDTVINLAVLKTHRLADFTLSLKNVMGILHPETRLRMHDIDLKGWIAEANLAWCPAINIIDGAKCFIDGGPDIGTERAPGVLLASRDRVALDVTGVYILQQLGSKSLRGMNPWRHPQIATAVALGLGVRSQRDIKMSKS